MKYLERRLKLMPNLSFRKKFKELLQPKDTGHDTHTSFSLCNKILKKIKPNSNQTFGVLFTLEFAIILIEDYGINPKNIWLFGDSPEKKKIANHLGINYNRINVLQEINMKFDVIVGNPPYNSGNEALWKKFSRLAIDLSPVVVFITPRNIVNGTITQKGANDSGFFNIIKKNLEYLDFSADNYFDVGKKICGWIYNKNHNNKTFIETTKNESLVEDITKYNYLPYNFDKKIDFSIFQKIYTNNNMLEFTRVNDKKNFVGPCLVAPEMKHISLKYLFVVNDLSSDSRIDANDIVSYKLSQKEIAGCDDYIKSNLFKYIFNMFGGSDVRVGIYKKFPKIDFTKRWSNIDLYNLFQLSKEEIKHIEDVIK